MKTNRSDLFNANNRFMKKIISFLLVIVFIFTLSSCARDDGPSYEDYIREDVSISRSEAISIAKNSKKVQDEIADFRDLKFYYTPDWGTCTASESGQRWEVTLKGTITGYADDYKDDFRYGKTFKATVTVSPNGTVTKVYVSSS